jgi:cyanophycin synthetase
MEYLFLLIILLIIFNIVNYYLNQYEHMSMQNTRLNKVLEKNGYEIDINNYIIKKDNNIIQYETKNFNSLKSHTIAKNKPLTNSIFAKNNIPVPKHWIINENNKDFYIYKPNKIFPCVLKPVDGMQGTDVNTFIKNNKQFTTILNYLLQKYKQIMMEEQVYGDNYRIFIFNNKVIDIIKREQPFIIGNSIDTINKLINDKNEEQLYKKLFATKNIDWNYIIEQGYNKEDILEKDVKIFITNTINFHNGANPTRVDLDKVPNINKNMFIKAHKLIGLECSGIDYMSNNIYVSYKTNNGNIIEINDMVDTQIHVDADNKQNENFLFENILKSFSS